MFGLGSNTPIMSPSNPPQNKNFSPNKSPSHYRFKNEKLRCELARIEDPTNFATVLFKEKRKRKETKITKARDRKLDRLHSSPQMHTAISASVELPISNCADSCTTRNLLFDRECELKGLLGTDGLNWTPQMFPFSSMAPGVTVSLDEDAVKSMEDLRSTLKGIGESMSDVSVKVDHGQPFGDLGIILLIVTIIWTVNPKTRNEKILVCGMIASYVCTKPLLTNLLTNSSIFGWLKSEEVSSPQGAFSFAPDQEGLATMLVTLINTYLCVAVGKEVFSPKVFVKTMGDLNRVSGTVGGMIKGMTMMVYYVKSSLDSWFNGTPFFLKSGQPFIDEFLETATGLISSFEDKTLYNIQTSVDKVNACILEGNNIQMKVPGGSQYQGVRTCILNHLTELTKIRKALMASNFKYTGIRQEPATIFLRGPPGTFKSQAMQHIAHAVISLTADEKTYGLYCEQPSSMVYNRQAENVYWDGYNAQHDVVMFDDVLQARDLKGSPDNEAMNVIRAVNVFEYQLHCAAMEKKGNTNFRSKFVLLNSNMVQDLELESIHEPGAFARRMDLVYDVSPKPQYAKNPDAHPGARKFDVSKFPKWTAEMAGPDTDLIGTTYTHPNMCEYQPMQLKGDRQWVPVGEVQEFEQVIELYMEVYKCKSLRQISYLKTLDQSLHKWRDQYLQQQRDLKSKAFDDLEMTEVDSNVSSSSFEEKKWQPQMDTSVEVTCSSAGFSIDPMTPEEQEEIMDIAHRPTHEIQLELDATVMMRLYSFFHNEFPNSYQFWATLMMHIYPYFRVFYGVDDVAFFGICFNRVERLFEEDFNVNMRDAWNVRDMPQIVDLNRHTPNYVYSRVTVCVLRMIKNMDNYSTTGIRNRISITVNPEPQAGSSSVEHISLEDEKKPRESRVPFHAKENLEYQILCNLDEERWTYLNTLARTNQTQYNMFIKMMIEQLMTAETIEGSIVLVEESFDSVKRVLETKKVMFDQAPYYAMDAKLRKEQAKHFAETKREDSSSFREILLERKKNELESIQVDSGWMTKLSEVWLACWRWLTTPTDSVLTAAAQGYVFGTGVYLILKSMMLIKNLVIPAIVSMFPHSNERHSQPGRSRIRRLVSRPKEHVEIGPQSVQRTNQNLVSIMKMVSKRSTFSVYFPLPKDERKPGKTHASVGFALGLRGRVLLLPYHFVSWLNSHFEDNVLDAVDLVGLKKPDAKDGEYILLLTVKEFLDGFQDWSEGETSDLAMVRMPTRFQPIRDILSHVASEKQSELYKKVESVLYIPRTGLEEGNEYHSVFAEFAKNFPVGSDEYEPYVVKKAYEYSAHTSPGDCGGQLWVNDKSNPALLIGMHVAGITPKKFGFSAMITRELLERGLNLIKEEDIFDYSLPELVPTDKQGSPQMYIMGRAAPGIRVPNRIVRSKLRPSVIKDKVHVSTKAPAKLLPFVHEETGETIDPLDLALKNYCQGDVYIDPGELQLARASLSDHLENTVVDKNKVFERRVYSFEEAVLGDGPGSSFTSINRSKSAGYPYSVQPGNSTKERFFGSGPEFDLNRMEAKELKLRCHEVIDKARSGLRSIHVFTDCLKDERRSIAKVNAGKTRLFSGSPTILLIVTRMYFGAFMKWIIDNRINNGIAIGVNEYSSEWGLIAELLNQFGIGPNKGAGDFIGYDTAGKAQIFNICLEVIQLWYCGTPGDNLIRAILFMELVNSLHINEGVFMYWSSALPSGHALTALINCLYNAILFRLCWYRAFKDVDSSVAYRFNKFCYLIVLGDDNAYSVHQELAPYFTERHLQVLMKEFGQTYTPEDKALTSFDFALRDIESISFLKRSFRKLYGSWVAPLDLETVLDIPNWTKEGANYLADTEANIRIALEELTLHGREVFNKWCPLYVNVCRETPGMSTPEITSFDVLFASVKEREGDSLSKITSLLSDYDDVGGKTAEPQAYIGRFEKERAGLFRLTSRMARWQSQQYPGFCTIPGRLIRRLVLKRIANPQMNTEITSTDNRVAVTRDAEIDTDNQGSSTTRIVADGEVVMAQPVAFQALDRKMLSTLPTGTEQSIKDFFARPVVLFQDTFKTTDTIPLWQWGVQIPHDLLNSGPWKNKLLGSAGFRGDLHLTLAVNANKFQQGRYIVCYVPNGGSMEPNRWFARTHSATLTQVTQLPHVEIDLSCDTEAVIVIPHVNAMGWSYVGGNTVNANYMGSTGEVQLRPYSPLVAPTGSTTAGFTIFGHWENIEFATAINPQSGMRSRTRVKRRVKPSDAEQASQGMGPVESGLIKVSQIMGKLGGIPLLSSVAQPVSWALDIASQAAGAFGWSRPHNGEHATIMTPYAALRMTNVDVADNSTKLGYTDKNEIEEISGFAGSQLDELSIDYLKGISAFIYSFTWSSSSSAGSRLAVFGADPSQCSTSTSVGSTTVTHMAPVMFLSTLFGLYRGSLKYTFKIVKTEFHSGRLQISFLPVDANYGTPTMPNATAYSDINYLSREIIDVRNGSEFTIIAPFTSMSQYRSTKDSGAEYGRLLIDVLDPLVAPSSVSSSVTILVEVSAAEDMEFAQPSVPYYTPVCQYQPQMGKNTCEIVAESVGGSTENNNGASSRACIGERITSLRQIIKRFTAFKRYTGTSYSATTTTMTFYPFMNNMGVLGSALATTLPTQPPDLLSIVSSCYALCRGGVRLKFINLSAANPKVMISSYVASAGDVYSDVAVWDSTVDVNNWRANRSQAFFDYQMSGAAEVEFPYYSRYMSTAVGDTWSCNNTAVPPLTYKCNTTVPKTFGRLNVAVVPTADFMIYRAASDDYSLGLFVSVPPVIGYERRDY